jgi:chromate transporter
VKTLFSLFLTFSRIGAFTFGGGYAMIPLIQREASQKRGWVSDEDILEIVAIAESTPGPIAINAATFVGYRVAGIPGAVCATLGVVAPSFLIILAIASVLREFQENLYVQYAFRGIRAAVLALIIKALWGMYKK